MPTHFTFFDPPGKISREPQQVSAFTIVTASPDPRHYHQFNKQIGNAKYYMPCWTRDEINSILSYFPNLNIDTVASRFDKYGGIPRYVLTKTDNWHESLKSAIVATGIEELQRSVGGPELLPSVSHDIFHYNVDSSSEYSCPKVSFASDYIADRITTKLFSRIENKQLDLLWDLANTDQTLASFRGHLLEAYAHKVLQGNGTWKLCALTGNKQTQLMMSNNELSSNSSENIRR